MTTSVGDNGGEPTIIQTVTGATQIALQNPADSAVDLYIHQNLPAQETPDAYGITLVPGDTIVLSFGAPVWVASEGDALASITYTPLA